MPKLESSLLYGRRECLRFMGLAAAATLLTSCEALSAGQTTEMREEILSDGSLMMVCSGLRGKDGVTLDYWADGTLFGKNPRVIEYDVRRYNGSFRGRVAALYNSKTLEREDGCLVGHPSRMLYFLVIQTEDRQSRQTLEPLGYQDLVKEFQLLAIWGLSFWEWLEYRSPQAGFYEVLNEARGINCTVASDRRGRPHISFVDGRPGNFSNLVLSSPVRTERLLDRSFRIATE